MINNQAAEYDDELRQTTHITIDPNAPHATITYLENYDAEMHPSYHSPMVTNTDLIAEELEFMYECGYIDTTAPITITLPAVA